MKDIISTGLVAPSCISISLDREEKKTTWNCLQGCQKVPFLKEDMNIRKSEG